MHSAPDFLERRFQTAAAHYRKGRAPYPARLIDDVADMLHLSPADRLMDLGCGPAQLAAAFAPSVGQVLALDPEPLMLELARETVHGLDNVTVARGSSDDLRPELGSFRAVLIGRAFHWMDRPETLRRCEALLGQDGAVVLFGDQRPAIPENGWVREYEALLERWSATDAERARRKSDAFLPHISVLLDSAFSRLRRVSVVWRRPLTLDDLIQRALSQSSTSRARLGEGAEEMIDELHAEAAGWNSEGRFVEVLESSALIAQRAR